MAPLWYEQVPEVTARIFAWRKLMPWEHVPELVTLMSTRESRVATISAVRQMDANPGAVPDAAFDFYPGGHRSGEFRSIFDSCQSPIEEIFAAFAVLHATQSSDCWFASQYPACGYHVDFAVYPYTLARLNDAGSVLLSPCVAVELDGHDFHERTRAQASRDKSRDRKLTSDGWRVLRFTGSEVNRDPQACVREAFSLARSLKVPQ
jgi:hypothetical protein